MSIGERLPDHMLKLNLLQLGIVGFIDSLEEESASLLAESFASDPNWQSKVGFKQQYHCQAIQCLSLRIKLSSRWLMLRRLTSQ